VNFTTLSSIVALMSICIATSCAPRPYAVCSELRCTKPLTHDETVRAHEVRKAWGEQAPLHVEVSPN